MLPVNFWVALVAMVVNGHPALVDVGKFADLASCRQMIEQDAAVYHVRYGACEHVDKHLIWSVTNGSWH